MLTEMGEVPKFASVIAPNPAIAEVKLYLSGLPNVTEYGKLKLVAELHKSATEFTVKSTVGATVISAAKLATLVQPLAVQVAVYEVVTLGLTEILVPLMPLFQTTVPAQLLAVRVAF